MGGAVSSGRDNDELIDNLKNSNYIRSPNVEVVFRALDRADYMIAHERDRAYKDLAWRSGALHMSAPCIYSEVMEGLELKPGLTFLNIGSGTGYLSTLAGLIIGASGVNHGVEVHGLVVDYATKRLNEFLENSATLDQFDFCEPKFYHGNGLCLAPLQAPYDRVYCGAGCPEHYQNYFRQLIKVGGILVMPLNDDLVQVKRVSDAVWRSRSVLQVSFASLRVPTDQEATEHVVLEEQAPARLQALARSAIRSTMRAAILSKNPQLRQPEPSEPARKPCPRRICIPIEDDSDVEGLNALHDLDRATGASEMNALLSLVLSMGQNRVAGALRFDPIDSSSSGGDDDSSRDRDDGDDQDDDSGGGSGGGGGGGGVQRAYPFNMIDMDNVETFDNLEDMNRAIHRAMSRPEAGGEGGGEPTARGRLSVTLEYSAAAGAPPSPPAPAADTAAAADELRHSVSRRLSDILSSGGGGGGECSHSTEQEGGRRRARSSDEEGRDVPSEVEIVLQSNKTGTRTAPPAAPHMDVMPPPRPDSPPSPPSPPRATEPTTASKVSKSGKRQKLDSGIGEESSPSSERLDELGTESEDESQPAAAAAAADTSDVTVSGRRRVPKRSRRARRSSCSYSESSGEERTPRRCTRRPAARCTRRHQLSVAMKRAVRDLPLPHPLQNYVNYHRCFQL